MNKKELLDFIKEKQPNICQISCYKDGKEVYSDEWNDYKKIDTCHVMSATKSIVALLVGIALKKYIFLGTKHRLKKVPISTDVLLFKNTSNTSTKCRLMKSSLSTYKTGS